MNSIQSYLSSSLFSQIKTRDINLNSKSYLSILRDDRLAFGMGTKFRKFYGIHKTFENKNIRSVFLQGELHSNALAAFCFYFIILAIRFDQLPMLAIQRGLLQILFL
ncbi:hypothetical protein LEP1GSC170_4530 [Leptospira interrogans serovar Bataviae str. HAI135]|nr:hypothetical protein LEP1GSC170_4530 [Leptospira interrogans serovar Bataviae str. HAI135]